MITLDKTIDSVKISGYIAASYAFDRSRYVYDSVLVLISALLNAHEKAHKENKITFNELQKTINKTYNLNIPKNTLRYMLERLEKKGVVELSRYQHNMIHILDTDILLPPENNIEEINLFFDDFHKRLIANGYTSLSINDVQQTVCEWIYCHSVELADFFSQRTEKIENTKTSDFPYAIDFIQYLLELKEHRSNHYDTVLRLYNGATQASLLNFRPKKIEQVAELVNENMKLQTLILDSNFVMRMRIKG